MIERTRGREQEEGNERDRRKRGGSTLLDCLNESVRCSHKNLLCVGGEVELCDFLYFVLTSSVRREERESFFGKRSERYPVPNFATSLQVIQQGLPNSSKYCT